MSDSEWGLNCFSLTLVKMSEHNLTINWDTTLTHRTVTVLQPKYSRLNQNWIIERSGVWRLYEVSGLPAWQGNSRKFPESDTGQNQATISDQCRTIFLINCVDWGVQLCGMIGEQYWMQMNLWNEDQRHHDQYSYKLWSSMADLQCMNRLVV